MNNNDIKASNAQFIAMLHFTKKGYRCYVDPAGNGGPVDFVAINQKTGKSTLIDVKTRRQSTTGGRNNRQLTTAQKKLGVKLIYVDIKKGKIDE